MDEMPENFFDTENSLEKSDLENEFETTIDDNDSGKYFDNDFGTISELDKTLLLSNELDYSPDSNIHNMLYYFNTELVTTKEYNDIDEQEHFIYIKYRKDAGKDSFNDSLQFKVRFN